MPEVLKILFLDTLTTGNETLVIEMTRRGNKAVWQLQTAKAQFIEFLDASLKDGPQVVTRRGVAAAVLIRFDEWERLRRAQPDLKALLLSDNARADIPLPPRGSQRRRAKKAA